MTEQKRRADDKRAPGPLHWGDAKPTMLVPKWAGEFSSYQHWVNKAQTWLRSPGYRPAICVDAKGRRCAIGADFMLARDEGAFPVRYFWECEVAAPASADNPSTPEFSERDIPADAPRAFARRYTALLEENRKLKAAADNPSTAGAGTPRVDALMAKWDDDGATRGSAFIELRDLARELELAAHPAPAAQAECRWPMCQSEEVQQQVADQAFRELYSGDSSTTPEQAAQSDDEFLSTRLARVARVVGYKMPDGDHAFIAGVAGTILGDIARKLESAAQEQARAAVPDGLTAASLIVRDVCELDYTGENWDHESMLSVTVEDLRLIVERHVSAAAPVAAAAPAGDAEDAQTQAARDVLAERRRQVEAEGWTPRHDDMHGDGQMAVAAGYYALACGYPHERDIGHRGIIPTYWPWAPSWWKPSTARRNLVKAGALILAEIERLDRAADAEQKGAA